MAKIESYLVGLDGKNGLRGELRQYQKQTQEQLDTVFVRINSIGVNMLKTVSGIIGALGGITGVVYALYRIFTGEL